MCHACVMDSVKQRMISRRGLFVGAAAVASAAVAAAPVRAQSVAGARDLTHVYDEDFPTYFGAPGVSRTRKFTFAENGFNLLELTLNEHTGTHVDAPLHFSADGASVDEIPVGDLVAPLAVIDIREKAAADDEAQVTPDDLKGWIAAHGPLPERCCVAMLSGWDRHVATPKYRNVDGDGKMRFPGVHIEATQMLLEESSAVGMAVDTLSLDIGSSGDFATHYAWLPAGRWGVENMANLADVPPAGATLVLGAPSLRGGTGGPARAIALV